MKVAPSVLGCNFLELQQNLKKIKNADYIHLDIMDGHFVDNISFGPFISKLISQNVKNNLDIHLMLTDPLNYIDRFNFSNTKIITIHSEANNPLDCINKIKSINKKAGISIKPKTSINSIIDILDKVDVVLVMSVEPGFGGQAFIENTYEKVSALDEIRKSKNLKFEIEVDGGIDLEITKKLSNLKTDIVVVGSFLFKQKNIKNQLKLLQKV